MFAPVAHLLDVLASSAPKSAVKSTDKISAATFYVPAVKKNNASGNLSVEQVFDNVKRRKVTKSHLFDMFNAVNDTVAAEISEQASVREALTAFKSLITSSEWETLNKIIEGTIEFDPFLRGMLRK